jgi:ATP-binding cassette subfamily C protein CydD
LAPEVYFPLRNAASLFHASADGSQALEQLQEVHLKKLSSIEPIECDFSRVDAISWSRWGLNVQGRDFTVIEPHTIKSGEIHFILGESGVGKSTFALNLLGITHEAAITIHTATANNLLVPEVNASWFKNLGWIPQLPQLAHGSLRDQFRLISPIATDEEIEKILSLCGLQIRDLPNGLETVLGGSGEGANTASGGQIRKIAVARALFSNPQVLIADEPTADLDSESAVKVMKALRSYAAAGAIVVCITHDLSIVKTNDSQQSFVSKVLS